MKRINVFLGGGVALLEGDENQVGYRPSVVDPVISNLNSIKGAKHFFIVKTYANLIHEYTPEGHQEHYLRYVEKEADIALFIFDGRIGDETKKEVEYACNNSQKTKHPTIFFYGTNLDDKAEIVEYLNYKNQYFQHFNNKEHLKSLISNDLSRWNAPATIPKLLKKSCPVLISIFCLLLVWMLTMFVPKTCQEIGIAPNDSVYVSTECNLSLHLMKYSDLNRFTNNAYEDSLLTMYHYEKAVNANGDLCIYPVSPILSLNSEKPVYIMDSFDSIQYHNPVFQLSMEGRQEETIIFNKAEIEVDEYSIEDPFYRFIKQGNMLFVQNESNVQQSYKLEYSLLHPEESFLKYGHKREGNGFADTICIPMTKNTQFVGCLNNKFKVCNIKQLPQCASKTANIITIQVNKSVHSYPLNKYNTTRGETKVEFSRTLSNKEIDEETYFSISAKESCSFRLRIKLQDINKKVAYSNYIYLRYIKPRSGKLTPKS